MSAKLDEATALLTRAKDVYIYGLVQVDKALTSAVSANPAELTAARLIQQQFVTGLSGNERLLPGMQPPFSAVDLLQIADVVTAVRA